MLKADLVQQRPMSVNFAGTRVQWLPCVKWPIQIVQVLGNNTGYLCINSKTVVWPPNHDHPDRNGNLPKNRNIYKQTKRPRSIVPRD